MVLGSTARSSRVGCGGETWFPRLCEVRARDTPTTAATDTFLQHVDRTRGVERCLLEGGGREGGRGFGEAPMRQAERGIEGVMHGVYINAEVVAES